MEAQLARVRPDLLTGDADMADAPRAAPGALRDLSVARHA
jgi:hypothetical protein